MAMTYMNTFKSTSEMAHGLLMGSVSIVRRFDSPKMQLKLKLALTLTLTLTDTGDLRTIEQTPIDDGRVSPGSALTELLRSFEEISCLELCNHLSYMFMNECDTACRTVRTCS